MRRTDWKSTANRGRSLAAAIVLVASATVSTARAGEPVRQPCDCCKLVCVEAEILKAQRQRDFYKGVPANTKMTQADYEAAEQQAADRAESDRVKYADGNETCNYYDPNLADAMELRRMQAAGFQFGRNNAGTIVGRNYSLRTNPSTCTANEEGLKYAPKIAACAGIGEAQVAHERKHIEDCQNRPADKRTRTVGQTAQDEQAGYDREIQNLEQLRFDVATKCKSASCGQDKAAWDRAADGMILSIDDVLQKGPPKPPSSSPLSTRAGKGARKGGPQ